VVAAVVTDAADPVDAALAGFLSRQDRRAEARLTATGEAGVRRTIEVYFGRPARPFADPVAHLGREAGDRWGAALAVVGAAHPASFMDLFPAGSPSLQLLAVLGEVNDPRAVDLLLAHVRDRDWLVRYNAVAALRRQPCERARAGIEAALKDEEPVVRAEAIAAIAASQPERARTLFEELLTHPALTPVLRTQVLGRVRRLRSRRRTE
jgi:hypothetical protein